MPGKRTSLDLRFMVYYNHSNGKSVKELAEMFSLTQQTIYNIINRVNREERLLLNASSGRPRKTTDKTENILRKKIVENPQISLRSLAIELKAECGVDVSHETVRQRLQQYQFASDPTNTLKNDADSSRRTIFIENLKYTVTEDKLKELFSTCGQIDYIHLSKNRDRDCKGVAYICFKSHESINAALKLNESVLEDHCIHVECYSAKNPTTKIKRKVEEKKDKEKKVKKRVSFEELPNDEEKNLIPEKNRKVDDKHSLDVKKTIFVGNLINSISEFKLRDFFSICGDIEKIQHLQHGDKDCNGVAYISFKKANSVDLAMKLNGSILDGYPIHIEYYSPKKLRHKLPLESQVKIGKIKKKVAFQLLENEKESTELIEISESENEGDQKKTPNVDTSQKRTRKNLSNKAKNLLQKTNKTRENKDKSQINGIGQIHFRLNTLDKKNNKRLNRGAGVSTKSD